MSVEQNIKNVETVYFGNHLIMGPVVVSVFILGLIRFLTRSYHILDGVNKGS